MVDDDSNELLTENPLQVLRRESLDIYNRIHSIVEDVLFVNQVHNAYPGIPLLPNLRCGAWYTDPAIITPCPAYFKSTDGHFANWNFSLRRPNLHLLPLAAANNGTGLILVDSTRAGKRIPDALSKTVPIWCAVVNRAVALRFPEEEEARTWKTTTRLYTPPGAVSAQEHDQIAARVELWAVGLAASSYTLPDLPRPLRPLWITPASGTFPSPPSECIPVICVSASRQAALDRRTGGYAYVQGSGDDHELWGMGLDPDVFWRHQPELLNASRLELPQLVQTLVANRVKDTGSLRKLSRIERVQGRISIAAISDLTLWEADTAYIIIYEEKAVSTSAVTLQLPMPPGKKGQLHLLQQVLPQAIAFAQKHLSSGLRLCVACRDGVDTSPGVALAVLQSFFDDQGDFTAEPGAIISIPPRHLN